MATIPPLAQLNHDAIPLLGETRQLSSCTDNVLLPFANTKIPDPDFPQNSDLFYKQAPRALVGSGGREPHQRRELGMFHVEVGAGPFTVAQTDGAGEQIFGQSAYPLEATRPAKPDARPVDRPNVPCETQLPPDLHAPTQKASSGLIDLTSQTPLASTSAMAPDIAKLHENGAAHRPAAPDRSAAPGQGPADRRPAGEPRLQAAGPARQGPGPEVGRPEPARPQDGQVKTAIRKHLGDFMAIIGAVSCSRSA